MKKIFFVFCFALVAQMNYAQEDESFKKEVLKLIEISGTSSQMKLVKDQLLKMIPKDKQKEFEADFEASLPEMYNNYAKIYTKLYTKEDIKAMIAFYESPVGKKIYANSSEMTQRTQGVSQLWMSKLQEVIAKYRLP